MANRNGKCIICGASPTVKSHIMPRALMSDIRSNGKSLIQGNRSSPGYSMPQNGDWDDTILCKLHEDQIGAGDDYAIKFIRAGTSKAVPVEQGRGIALPNPKPDLLMHFVYAVIWRRVVSKGGKLYNLDLGRYEPIIRNALLNDGPYGLQTLAGLSGLGLQEMGEVKLALDPYRQKLGPVNCWHFILSGFEFFLITDQRQLPGSWNPYLVNGNDPLIVTVTPFNDLRQTPLLQSLLRNMLSGPRPRQHPKL